ncbi:MAG: outer membrane protein assembly factor BamD [Bacteroidales bacterium]|nr:outer membrane protein assembly factor BamD [Bacteroidales bacterium]
MILFITLMYSCSEFQKLLKSNDFEMKYQNAIKYYEKGDYFKARSLLEGLENVYKVSDRADKILYYLGQCYFKEHNYYVAAYYFNSVGQRYPLSPYKEEADYMSAYCLYLDSPDYLLDQTSTYKAIDALQEFINTYPHSKYVKHCNEMIDKLRNKLETKSFEAARLYYNMEEYKSAIVSFKNLLEDFPDTQYKEDAYYYIIKASYLHAINSIESKKKERLNSTISEYQKFISEFSNSKYLEELKKIYYLANEYLKK